MQKKNMMRFSIVQNIVFYLGLILLWQLSYYLGVYAFPLWKPYAVPSPDGVFKSFLFLINGRSLLVAICASMKHAVIGFGLSICIGGLLGILMIKVKYLNHHIKTLILGLQTLPSICWVPFAILWYGLNDRAIIFVIVIGSTFSIAISIENGIHNVDPLYIRAAKTMGAKDKDLYNKVILPAAIPSLIAGLKQGWSFAWRALMAGEMMACSIGLGQILLMGRDLGDINQVMVVMIIIVVIGTLIDRCIFQTIELRVRRKMGLDRDRG